MGKIMIKPTANRVLVSKFKPEEKKGNLYIPQASQEKPNLAQIIAVGSKANKELKAGQHVIIQEYGGKAVKDGDQEYYLMEDTQILAICTNS